MAQIADGIRTDYVQDVSLPLPQLLTAEQGGTINRYLRGLGLIGEQQGNAWQYHLPDALGSVRQLTDPQGHVVLAQHFDPFGAPTIVNRKSEIVNRYGFAGEEQDDSGHVFLRARTYNPETGRFLQSDPVLGMPDQPRTLHRYAYAFNNPVNYTDPAGLMPPQTGSGGGFQGQRVYPPSHSYNAATPRTQRGTGGNYTRQATVTAQRVNALSAGGPARSANSGGIPIVRASVPNNYTRAQSQGQRPQNCNVGRASSNPLDVLFGIRDSGRSVMDTVQGFVKDPASGLSNLWDTALNGWQRTLTEARDPNTWTLDNWQRTWHDVRGGASLGLDLIPVIGDIKGVIEGLVGYDLAGNKLSKFEQSVAIAGALLGMFTIADELIDAGKLLRHVANNSDFAGDLVKARRGLSHVDELAGTAGLGRYADEALDAAPATRLRNLDGFTGGSPVTKQGDELRQAFVTKPRGRGLNRRSGSLSERLKATAAHRKAGNDLNDPSVRYMINRGLGPIQGGSGASVRGPDGLGLRERYKRSQWRQAGYDVNNPAIQRFIDKGYSPKDVPSNLARNLEASASARDVSKFNQWVKWTEGDLSGFLIHFTDEEGYNGIRSLIENGTRFRLKPSVGELSASRGVYFIDGEPIREFMFDVFVPKRDSEGRFKGQITHFIAIDPKLVDILPDTPRLGRTNLIDKSDKQHTMKRWQNENSNSVQHKSMN